MELLDVIKTRRSVRKFLSKPVEKATLMKIVECGRWAPSGLNHQPWQLIGVLNREILDKLATTTSSGHMLKQAPCAVMVYLDKSTQQYSYVKNCQGIGALFQNMLLGIHDLGLGACWLGEILNQKAEVNEILHIDEEKDQLEFMGGIVIGHPHPSELEKEGQRKPLDAIFRLWGENNE